MEPRSIPIAAGPLAARIGAIPSKSVTHRALVAAALSRGVSEIVDPLDATDTRVTAAGLVALGFDVRALTDRWLVTGGAGEVPGGGTLDLGESGTSLRLLLALAALGAKPAHLDGAPRLRERPAAELATALVELGARIEGPRPGQLPLRAGGRVFGGGTVRLPGGRSSQFASALLLAGTALDGGLLLHVEPPAVSRPYIALTAEVMRAFDLRVDPEAALTWRVARGAGCARTYRVEGDHSSASYFLVAAAVVGGSVTVAGLRADSLQPDARLASLLADLDCRVEVGGDAVTVHAGGRIPGFEVDLADTPDLGPSVAVLALFADGPSRIGGVAHLRLKESDRLDLLARNLRALGRDARATADSLVVGGVSRPRGAVIQTAGDHRMAMAFAVAGLRQPGIVIDDPACVAKSNPSFWEQVDSLR